MSEYSANQPSFRNRPRLREAAMAEQGKALCERGKATVDKECFNA